MIDTSNKQICACPLNGKECRDGIREDFSAGLKCRWWQHLYGKDPQSEKMIDQWDCAVAWLPITTIEASQMSRQTGASVDKVANEVATLKSHLAAVAGSIRVAGAGISQAIESGSLTVMLPSPGTEPQTNGHVEKELNEGEHLSEN
jgi:hypothetical protein